MRLNDEKLKVLELRAEGSGYKKISRATGLSRDIVRGIGVNKKLMKPGKRGPKFLLQKREKTRIKRCNARLTDLNEKANSRKIIAKCQLYVCQRTLQLHLKATDFKYKSAKKITHCQRRTRNAGSIL